MGYKYKDNTGPQGLRPLIPSTNLYTDKICHYLLTISSVQILAEDEEARFCEPNFDFECSKVKRKP
jgi:hypothetical protein